MFQRSASLGHRYAGAHVSHTVISTRPAKYSGVYTETERQPWIASRMFLVTSSIVSPWETQPGNAGTSAQ